MEIESIRNIDFDDGKKRVLLLGNGISRNNFSSIYSIWKGEIWGCNWVYKEYLEKKIPRLDVLIGDYVCLKVANQLRKKELKNTLFLGKSQKSIEMGNVEYPKGFKNQFSDSGSALTVHAIESGYEEVYLLGFDLGGRDIYQKRHHLRNKKSWVKSWRKVNKLYGLSNIYFIGYDHKKYIQGTLPEDYYAKLYMRGQDHLGSYYRKKEIILTEEDKKLIAKQKNNKKGDTILILGNGKSRREARALRFIQNWRHEIWGCNEVYTERKQLPSLDRVGAGPRNVFDNITRNYENLSYDFDLYISSITAEYPYSYLKFFQDVRGYTVGSQMILQALYEEYEYIYLIGFDLGGQDVYGRKTKGKDRMVGELREIIDQHGLSRFNFITGVPKILM